MEVGIIGLGKMGFALARNLSSKGVKVHGFDVRSVEDSMINTYDSVNTLIENMDAPRIVWLMLPAKDITNNMILELSEKLTEDDILIDGANAYFMDTINNYKILKNKGINYLDCGTSGGVEGALNGPCLMIGGDREVYCRVEELFKLAAENGSYGYTGLVGSGHYSKMIHNGIEYAMMQAIAEGLNLLDRSDYDYNLKEVTRIWSEASIISGYLMDVTHELLKNEDRIRSLSQRIDSSGSGKWTAMEALRLETPIPTISASLNVRYASVDNQISNKLVSGMRNAFGGHKVYEEEE